jgi:hypothetical protein
MIKFLLAFFISSSAFSQQLIEGIILDHETGKPVPFASIGIVETSKGTSSNINGQFSLSITGEVSIKITCIGYETLVVKSPDNIQLIRLMPIATQLNQVVVLSRAVNPTKIVRKAFASLEKNYNTQSFMQKFFYRHYCKDNSFYGRLIEATVDVWKNDGYSLARNAAGDKEEIRVTQLRRSLDKTTLAQGHEPISIKNILQADGIGYQTGKRSDHISFFTDVNNLKTDFHNYTFTFEGITSYDGDEVYEIAYSYKSDSVLMTSGKYMPLCKISGSLFIDLDTYAFVKTEELKQFENNSVRTTAYYRKYDGHYYPYQLIRQGETTLNETSTHSFRIDLMSLEVRKDSIEKFAGKEQTRDELLNIPYDSIFWSTNTILKTTPLEDEIIRDLGEGLSLNKQFYFYKQYEMNLRDGGINAEQKFNWLKENSKGKRILYLVFWSENFRSYFAELEYAKRLANQYRNKVMFVFLSLDDDDARWQQTMARFAYNTDGIVNYRLGAKSETLKSFIIEKTPAFILLTKNGELFDQKTKNPSDPLLENDFKLLLEQVK